MHNDLLLLVARRLSINDVHTLLHCTAKTKDLVHGEDFWVNKLKERYLKASKFLDIKGPLTMFVYFREIYLLGKRRSMTSPFLSFNYVIDDHVNKKKIDNENVLKYAIHLDILFAEYLDLIDVDKVKEFIVKILIRYYNVDMLKWFAKEYKYVYDLYDFSRTNELENDENKKAKIKYLADVLYLRYNLVSIQSELYEYLDGLDGDPMEQEIMDYFTALSTKQVTKAKFVILADQ